MLALLLAFLTLSDDYSPFVHGPSKEAESAIAGFETAPGLKVELVAAEPLLANPVCFTVDRIGRIFVAETFRLHAGVTDTRGHMYWLDDDLACRNIADRVAMYKKHIKDLSNWTTDHDRIKVLWSSTGSSKPDKSAVFADGFHNLDQGLGAGLLVRDDAVYYTCIPDLWKLAPTKAGEKSPTRESLANGFGVHTGFIGHDLHGLTLGPDGRLYFSIGDRGLRVKTKEGTILNNPDSGAVLRCEQDGSHLEIFCSGLRNPQELAFNDVGDLFTCDNNSDSGDMARWLHLVEGGEYGWRMGYQYHDDAPGLRGPWNNELLWKPDVAERAAYIIPPLRNFSDGPSGLAYNPGVTRLGDKWKNAFFLCDFRGTPGQSGVRVAWLKPKGAGYEFDRDDRIVWRTLVTDCEFGPDGGLYFSDWVDGWNKPNKGRIYRVFDPKLANDAKVAEVQKLLAAGFSHRTPSELLQLLSHPDRRIRQEAQEALVKKNAVAELCDAASKGDTLRRLHGIWGLGHLLRTGPKSEEAINTLRQCMNTAPSVVRGKAALALADAKDAPSAIPMTGLIKDGDPALQRDVLLALSRIANDTQIDDRMPILLAMEHFEKDFDQLDAVLKHAAVMALSKYSIRGLVGGAMPAPSLATVLVCRRRDSSGADSYLEDPVERIALEAARAVYDSITDRNEPASNETELSEQFRRRTSGLSRLADCAKRIDYWSDPYLRRVAAANYRIGLLENASNLAHLATESKSPNSIRRECLYELAHWAKPDGKDRVLGNWWPIAPRSPEPAKAALIEHKDKLLAATASDSDSRRQLIEAVRMTGASELLADVRTIALSDKETGAVRTEALKTLAALKDSSLRDAATKALASSDADLRAEARRHLASIDPASAVPALAQVVDSGDRAERQAALATLATIAAPAAEAALLKSFERLKAGAFPKDAELDLLLAADAKATPALKSQLQSLAAKRDKKDPLADYRACLEGGDAHRGKKIFDSKTEVYCLRCHRVGSMGGEVGPSLKDIAQKKPREYILESIVNPNAKIAEGFESVLLELEDGRTLAGVLRSETSTELRIITAEAKNLTIDKKTIAERRRGPSAMPQDAIKHLSKRELRDLVEYLVVQPKN